MIKFRDRIKNWAIRHAEGPHGKFWLSLFSFAESSFFPIPPDILLVAILLARQRHRWVFWGLLTTIFSLLGGLFGYLIGFLLFEAVGKPLISFYNLEEQVLQVSFLFSKNTFLTMFIAAFTPIPYKVFTIAGGLFTVPILPFGLASLLGRGIRFFAEAFLLKVYGARIARVLYKYFNIFSVIIVAIVVVLVILML